MPSKKQSGASPAATKPKPPGGAWASKAGDDQAGVAAAPAAADAAGAPPPAGAPEISAVGLDGGSPANETATGGPTVPVVAKEPSLASIAQMLEQQQNSIKQLETRLESKAARSSARHDDSGSDGYGSDVWL